MTKEKKDILDNWSETEKEDALVATYDESFAQEMIKSGSQPVKKVISNKNYRTAIEEINLDGGFVN